MEVDGNGDEGEPRVGCICFGYKRNGSTEKNANWEDFEGFFRHLKPEGREKRA